MNRLTGKRPDECTTCHGLGYTRATAADMRTVWRADVQQFVEVSTVKVGSGCPTCLGRGVLK